MLIALEISALRSKQPDHTQSKHTIPVEPNRVTYWGFKTETYISQKKAQSFLAHGWKSIVKQLRVISYLHCFRRPTASHKPSNVEIAAYIELRQKKAALIFKIIKQFVKELKSNDPKTWFALNKYDHHYLHEISTKSPELTMPTILLETHRCIYGTDDGSVNSEFSSSFLLLMQGLETKIVASLKELAEQPPKDAAENNASHAKR